MTQCDSMQWRRWVATHQKTQQGLKRLHSLKLNIYKVSRNASENPTGIETVRLHNAYSVCTMSQRIRKPNRDWNNVYSRSCHFWSISRNASENPTGIETYIYRMWDKIFIGVATHQKTQQGLKLGYKIAQKRASNLSQRIRKPNRDWNLHFE